MLGVSGGPGDVLLLDLSDLYKDGHFLRYTYIFVLCTFL